MPVPDHYLIFAARTFYLRFFASLARHKLISCEFKLDVA
jgi:hypothetical protein